MLRHVKVVLGLALLVATTTEVRAGFDMTFASDPYPGIHRETWTDAAIPARVRVMRIDLTSSEIALYATAEAEQNKALNEAARLRRQAAKLTNIGINSGSDLLTRKSKQLRDRAGRIEDNLENLHRERSGDIRLGDGATHARVLLSAENVAVAAPDGSPLFRIGKLMVFQGDRIVILSTHIVSDLEATASRIALLEGGRLLRVATPDRLEYAVEAVSAGFQAEARSGYTAENSSDLRQGVRALVRALRRYRPYTAALKIGQRGIRSSAAAQVFFSNLPYFGFYRNGKLQGGLSTSKEEGFREELEKHFGPASTGSASGGGPG